MRTITLSLAVGVTLTIGTACSTPIEPTEVGGTGGRGSATLLAFGFPAAANPSAASSQLPITIILDGRVAGTITSMWTAGLLSEGGPGRLPIEVAPGVHTFSALGTSASWEETVTVPAGQTTARHLLCDPCTVGSNDLRNFGTFRALPNNNLEICVRDHECEDGDRVSVTLNGQVVFSNQKILNVPACRTAPAKLGVNSVLFRADNGTGFEGRCSFADENTGQISVRGSDRTATQTWSLRGGAGTQARLAVIP